MRARQLFLCTSFVVTGAVSTCETAKAAVSDPRVAFSDHQPNGTLVQWYQLYNADTFQTDKAIAVYMCSTSESAELKIFTGACGANQSLFAPAYSVKQFMDEQLCREHETSLQMLPVRPYVVGSVLPWYALVNNTSNESFTFIYKQSQLRPIRNANEEIICDSSLSTLSYAFAVSIFFVSFPEPFASRSSWPSQCRQQCAPPPSFAPPPPHRPRFPVAPSDHRVHRNQPDSRGYGC